MSRQLEVEDCRKALAHLAGFIEAVRSSIVSLGDAEPLVMQPIRPMPRTPSHAPHRELIESAVHELNNVVDDHAAHVAGLYR